MRSCGSRTARSSSSRRAISERSSPTAIPRRRVGPDLQNVISSATARTMPAPSFRASNPAESPLTRSGPSRGRIQLRTGRHDCRAWRGPPGGRSIRSPSARGGTSSATPLVAAIAGVLQAIRPNPAKLTTDELRSKLISLGDDITSTWGTGETMRRLNALRAVRSILPASRTQMIVRRGSGSRKPERAARPDRGHRHGSDHRPPDGSAAPSGDSADVPSARLRRHADDVGDDRFQGDESDVGGHFSRGRSPVRRREERDAGSRRRHPDRRHRGESRRQLRAALGRTACRAAAAGDDAGHGSQLSDATRDLTRWPSSVHRPRHADRHRQSRRREDCHHARRAAGAVRASRQQSSGTQSGAVRARWPRALGRRSGRGRTGRNRDRRARDVARRPCAVPRR